MLSEILKEALDVILFIILFFTLFRNALYWPLETENVPWQLLMKSNDRLYCHPNSCEYGYEDELLNLQVVELLANEGVPALEAIGTCKYRRHTNLASYLPLADCWHGCHICRIGSTLLELRLPLRQTVGPLVVCIEWQSRQLQYRWASVPTRTKEDLIRVILSMPTVGLIRTL